MRCPRIDLRALTPFPAIVAALVLVSGCFLTYNRTTLARDCAADDDNACLSLGFMYLKGQGGPKDAKGALDRFVRACELGNSIGCERAADIWDSSVLGHKNPRKAQMYRRMARELDAQHLHGYEGNK